MTDRGSTPPSTDVGTPIDWADQRRKKGLPPPPGGDDGDGDDGTLGIRVAHLETRMGRVEAKLDTIIERLGGIATRADMRNYVLAAIGIFVAIVAILVGSMGWLETRVARVQPQVATPVPPAPQPPIVIQLPYVPPAPKPGS